MILILFLFFQLAGQMTQSLSLTPKSGQNHLVHFSNKTGSFWVGETQKESKHFLMGLISYRETMFSDYRLSLDEKTLNRDEAVNTILTPWKLQRVYKKGINESLFMPDDLDGMALNVSHVGQQKLGLRFFGNGFEELILVDTSSSPHRVTLKTNKTLNRFITFSTDAKIEAASLISGDLVLTISGNKSQRIPDNGDRLVSIGLGNNEVDAQRTSILMLSNYDVLLSSKQKRIEDLVQSVNFTSSNPDLDKSFAWAMASFDALNMNETRTGLGKGIYAGYPWFQDYWGRDSFIALRALTVTGQFDLAKENLLSFLRYQVQDSSNSNYGKIPNRVRPDESIYNTADATPRFIIEAAEYYQYSGDQSFLTEVMPYIKHAILGTIKYRTDEKGFLVHSGADTWMDAVGPKGPYSPRGNRANDIQALWMLSLEKSRELLNSIRGYESLKTNTEQALEKVKASFNADFIQDAKNGSVIVDAISAENVKSKEVRVNQLFTLPILESNSQKALVIEQVTKELGTPYGPLSLSPKDEWFHPYHKVEPFYEQDASYHNGIIWVWNTGDFVAALMQTGNEKLASEIISNYSRRILTDVPIGTLPELYDAFPRTNSWSTSYPDSNEFKHISRLDQMALRSEAGVDVSKEPAASGTFSQAWSLSEYIRMIVEHMPGISKKGNYWILNPKKLEIGPSYRLNARIHEVKISMEIDEKEHRYIVENPTNRSVELMISLPETADAVKFSVSKGKSTIVVNSKMGTAILADGSKINLKKELNFFNNENELKVKTGQLNWTDFTKVMASPKVYKSHVK